MATILAVDDNPDNIQLILDIVEDMGHNVLKAEDGFQALAAIEKQLPDLILLDVNMPGMTGFQVLEKLKQDQRTESIPVILLTALSGVDHRVEGFGLGAEDYLVKPFSPLELIARIEARLRTKAQTDGLRETQQIIRQTFERFVSATVVDQILRDPSAIKLGGKLQEVTVLFADIENFTSISERTGPEHLLNILNSYHLLIVEVIQSNKGTIDKFIGDAVMALFNTPLELENHAFLAVQSAVQIRDALQYFHEQFEEQFRLKINFGVHTGMAVVGNVGAPQIMDYTAVGDTVNLAARLQDRAKDGQILITEATYNSIQAKLQAEPIGQQSYKGRQQSVMTYAVEKIKSV
jgi:adenylate cyclase